MLKLSDGKGLNIIFQCDFFEKTIFSEHLKKISYFHVFFWERSSFIFRLRVKIIFSGKRNISFPDNTRKIISLSDLFGKTIFSGRLEKEAMVFHAVYLKMFLEIRLRVLLLYFRFFHWHPLSINQRPQGT